ncbi:MAG: hypothetical protein QM706_02260 [Nitrospira sp.]
MITNFEMPLPTPRSADAGDNEPLAEARMISADCDGVRILSVYAPNSRQGDSRFYDAKLGLFRQADPLDESVSSSKYTGLYRRLISMYRLTISPCETLGPVMEARTFRSMSDRPMRGCRTRDSSMRTGCFIRNRAIHLAGLLRRPSRQ